MVISSEVRRVLGLAALFSGVALLVHILTQLSLPLAVAVTAAAMAAMVARVRAVIGRDAWAAVAGVLLRGAVTGVVATVTYDIAKGTLSLLDPSPYNPFEAVRVFGTLLIGADSPAPAVYAAGTAFHFLNGTAFGVAYTILFARNGRSTRAYAALSGMGWGLFLESFQLLFYPGWLGITFVKEFTMISALSHLVYGATLGLGVRSLLRRADPTVARPASSPGGGSDG